MSVLQGRQRMCPNSYELIKNLKAEKYANKTIEAKPNISSLKKQQQQQKSIVI